MKLHQILIGIVLMGLIVTGFSMFLSAGVATYSPTGYNASDIQEFITPMDNVTEEVNKTRDRLEQVGGSGFTDILGGIFQSGYTAVKTTVNSVDTMYTVSVAGAETLPIGAFTKPLAAAIVTIIMIVIFIGILFHVITKSDRT